jgi:hypothetical protein
MSDQLRRELESVPADGVVPLYREYYLQNVDRVLNTANEADMPTDMRDVINNADAGLMTTLSSDEDGSVEGFYLWDIPDTDLEVIFNMISESWLHLNQRRYDAVRDVRTRVVQGYRIDVLRAIRIVILARDSADAELVRSRINFNILDTIEGMNMPAEGPITA